MQPPRDPLPPSPRSGDTENPYAPPLTPVQSPAPVLECVVPTGPALQRSASQWRAHIRQRLRRGARAYQVWEEAVSEGLSAADAQRYIDEERASYRTGAVIALVVGALIALLGLVVTVATLLAAARQPGGEFFIWFGPVLLGGAVMLVGVFRLVRSLG